MHKDPNLNEKYSSYEKKVICEKELNEAKEKLQQAESILQMKELVRRKRVLRRLGYCTNQEVIQLKGRVACELSR